jgi:hypothetical protein
MSSKQKHKLNKKLKYCRNCPTGRKEKSPRGTAWMQHERANNDLFTNINVYFKGTVA